MLENATAAGTTAGPAAPPKARRHARWLPLVALAAALGLAYALGLHRYLSLEALAEHRAALSGLVAARPLLAGALYVAAYVAVVALSLPGGAIMTLAGGLLFGPWLGTALAVLGATLGACTLFLAARTALAEFIFRRAGPLIAPVREGLRRSGFWYLLSLRLIPVVPFWLANLAPACVGMPFWPYAAATLIGIIPGTAVFAGIGAGLGEIIDMGSRPDLSVIFSAEILLPLLGLAALSMLGAWWRHRKGAQQGA